MDLRAFFSENGEHCSCHLRKVKADEIRYYVQMLNSHRYPFPIKLAWNEIYH